MSDLWHIFFETKYGLLPFFFLIGVGSVSAFVLGFVFSNPFGIMMGFIGMILTVMIIWFQISEHNSIKAEHEYYKRKFGDDYLSRMSGN